MTPPIRLVIADDHPVVRDGLRGMFAGAGDIDVVGEAADGAEAVVVAERTDPDVVLLDLRMPVLDGPARVLDVPTYATDAAVLPAIEAGATGYLLKDAPRDELLRAVRAAARGEAHLAPALVDVHKSRVRAPAHEPRPPPAGEVLRLIARGTSNRDAAAALFVSEATVKTHLLHIYAKLGVNDRTAAVALAVERGLVRLSEA